MSGKMGDDPGSPKVRFASTAPHTPAITLEKEASNMTPRIDLSTVPSSPGTPESNVERRSESAASDNQRPMASRNNSYRNTLLYPQGDCRNSSMPDLRDLKADMMCNWLHQQQMERMWTANGLEEGVILKKTKDEYKCAPVDLSIRQDGLFDAVKKLNVKVC